MLLRAREVFWRGQVLIDTNIWMAADHENTLLSQLHPFLAAHGYKLRLPKCVLEEVRNLKLDRSRDKARLASLAMRRIEQFQQCQLLELENPSFKRERRYADIELFNVLRHWLLEDGKALLVTDDRELRLLCTAQLGEKLAARLTVLDGNGFGKLCDALRKDTLTSLFGNHLRIIETNVMKAEQGVVGWEWTEAQPHFQDRSFAVKFDSTFKEPPIVQLTIELLDTFPGKYGGTSIRISANEITKSSMVVNFNAWAGAKIHGCKVRWLALGEDGID